jgi:hypothetical protein
MLPCPWFAGKMDFYLLRYISCQKQVKDFHTLFIPGDVSCDFMVVLNLNPIIQIAFDFIRLLSAVTELKQWQ